MTHPRTHVLPLDTHLKNDTYTFNTIQHSAQFMLAQFREEIIMNKRSQDSYLFFQHAICCFYFGFLDNYYLYFSLKYFCGEKLESLPRMWLIGSHFTLIILHLFLALAYDNLRTVKFPFLSFFFLLIPDPSIWIRQLLRRYLLINEGSLGWVSS